MTHYQTHARLLTWLALLSIVIAMAAFGALVLLTTADTAATLLPALV